jgi:hypothetical protein
MRLHNTPHFSPDDGGEYSSEMAETQPTSIQCSHPKAGPTCMEDYKEVFVSEELQV